MEQKFPFYNSIFRLYNKWSALLYMYITVYREVKVVLNYLRTPLVC